MTSVMSDESSLTLLVESLLNFTQAIQSEDNVKAIELAPPALLLSAVAAAAEGDDEDDENENELSLSTAIYECYIKAMLQEEKFEDVLELWNPNHPSKTGSSKKGGGRKKNATPRSVVGLGLEHLRIYALYRLQRYEKAKELLNAKNGKDDDDTLRAHLLAQSLHHLEESGPAMELYSKLIESSDGSSTSSSDDKHQILTNLSAVACANATPFVRSTNVLEEQRLAMEALLDRLGSAEDDEADDVPDLAYNLATYELLTAPTEVNHWQSVLQKAVQSIEASGSGDSPKESALIKSNLDWSSQFWSGNAGGAGAVPMNQLSSTAKLVALTNRALSMAGSTSKSASDALRLVPAADNLIRKLTPLQMRLVTYNRALLQYRAAQYKDCLVTCQQVLDSVNSNKKKKATSSMIAQPTLVAEDAAWWESRIVVLQTLCRRAADNAVDETEEDETGKNNGQSNNSIKDSKHDIALQTALDKISKLSESPVRDSAVAYLQLHQASLDEKNNSVDGTIALLKSLPASIQKRRAVVATLASLYHQQGQDDNVQELLKEMGDDSAYADFLMGQQKYQQAADLYEKAAQSASSSGDESRFLTAQARYVQALSHVDPRKAQQVWSKIRSKVDTSSSNDDNVSGAELEVRELPRLKSTAHKDVTSATSAVPATDSKPKKSHEKILRQRARKREEYLAQLDKKGLRRVANPDPERWLPKYERSYNRRRRHRHQQHQQNQQHKGAQGGVSENDAAKLDVAARQAARNDMSSSSDANATSTAQTAVSTGGPRKGGRRR